jgi:alpha-tubulin suppressor-like RCC1 family protein
MTTASSARFQTVFRPSSFHFRADGLLAGLGLAEHFQDKRTLNKITSPDMKTRSTPVFAKRLLPTAALALAATFFFSLPAEAKNTTLAQWDFNTTNSTNVIKPSSGTNPTGVILGYGQGNPPALPSSIIYTGSMVDPGLTINGTIYNRALTVNPPLTSNTTNTVGVKFSTPTTGMGAGEAVQISFSQTIGFRSSRYWQILVSTNGINGTYSVPGNGTGSSFSGTISGFNSANASISGTANVTVSPTGFIDFRTINGNSLQPAVTNTGTQFTAPLAAGFVNNITITLPTGQGYENNANFAFAIVGAFDPAYLGSNGSVGYVSSFAGTNSTDSVNGYNRSLASGGSMRLDLVTISSVSQGPVASITATPSSLGNFSASAGTASASQSFTVNGTAITGNITATAPAGFEISTNNSSFSSSLQLVPTGGNVTATTVHTRISASASTGSLSGTLTLDSTGATTQNVTLSGTVLIPTLSFSTASLTDFAAQSGSVSAVQSFTVNGSDFAAPLIVTAPVGFEVSTDNSTYSPSLSIPQSGSNIPSTILYTRLASTAPLGIVSGNLTLTNIGISTQSVALSGIVMGYTTSSAASLGGFAAQIGKASTVQSFTVAGVGFTAPLAVTAPAGFEVSTDNSTFSPSLTIGFRGSIIESVYGGNFSIASGKIWYQGNGQEFPNSSAFAALKTDGSVVTWGLDYAGGNSTEVAGNLTSNVTAVYSTSSAFAALKTNGSVVTWGNAYAGGDSTEVAGNLTSEVTAVYSNEQAFAALKTDGSVVTWGNSFSGGDSSALAGNLSSNVTAVYSNQSAFAARKTDGSVVAWGDASSGGNFSISSVDESWTPINTPAYGNLTSNVTAVHSTARAFAALRTDGSVATWGSAYDGGDSTEVAGNLTSNVTAVYSNFYAFAALKTDGSVVTWGSAYYGGDSTAVASSLTSNVTAVYSTPHAFAALKSNGSVVTWGASSAGGNSAAVAANLTSNVTAVYSASYAFAALKTDGSVVTWGDAANGGNSTAVAASLASNVTAVYSTENAFAALKTDGSVVTWGDGSGGGNSTAVASNLSSNVMAVYSTKQAFAALKTDGSVVTWGGPFEGGSDGPANISVNFIPATTLYTRLASTAPSGAVSGNLTLASSGVTTQTVALSGSVASASSLATLASMPTSSSIRTTTATLGGEVTADGGAAITARGVVYSLTATDSDPQVGVSGVTNLPATGTTGVFSVNATALTPGAAYSFKAYATNSAGTSYSAAGTFTALRPVEGWRLSNFGDVANSGTGANAASPAGDGIPNLVKYALCLDPAQWGGLPQPEIGNNRLKMSFQRDPARSDITITVEGTSDLVNAPWVPVATSLAGGAFSGNGSVSETPLQGGLQQVEVSDSVDTLTDPRRRFLRIRATLPAD